MGSNTGLFKHEESALILIDYQPEMFEQMRSEPSEDLIDLNVRLLIGAAKAFDMPIILSLSSRRKHPRASERSGRVLRTDS
jgi:nicotinamidase-related amidase